MARKWTGEVVLDIKPYPAGPTTGTKLSPGPGEEKAMREAAQEFEAAYLAEVLKQSGINVMPEGFGGGAGEDAFSSLLTEEYARLLAARGGIGLAEQIFEAIKGRSAGE